MKDYLNNLPTEIKDLIHLAADVACANNMPIYLVGGFVRDLMLRVKNLDLDIVVEGDGIKFAEDFAHAKKAKLISHKRFGTATVILEHHQKIDIASARKEFYPSPAHLPVVSNGRLKDDLFRRDFTINAMAVSIGKENFGKLIDLFDGRRDLDNKNIRVLHDLSFIDDPTRILRAIRFEKRYGFRVESKTLKLLKSAVKNRMLNIVQPQRLRDELILILREDHPIIQIRRIQELTGFSFINPSISISKKTYSLLKCIEKQVNWFKKTYSEKRKIDTWLMYFFALIDHLNISEIKTICKRYAFSKGEEKRMLNFKKINRRFILGLSREKIKPANIFSLLEPLSYEVILMIKAKYKDQVIQKHIEDFFEIYNGMRIYIGGDDLHRLGFAPGPFYKKIFTRVLNAKLNGKVKTKEEELSLIKKLLKT